MLRSAIAIVCIAVVMPGESLGLFNPTVSPQSSTSQETTKIPVEQLDSLVAPIALYPDPLLAQTLAASTYPLELIQLQQWLVKNKDLKDKALADAEHKRNVSACLRGRDYCDLSRLSPAEAAAIPKAR